MLTSPASSMKRVRKSNCLGLPRKIKGVDGNAVAAQAGAGIKGLEAEGLGLGGVDDFVNVDAHAHAELLQLVDQRDVDAAVDVLEQLGHLRDGRAADRNDAAEDGAVEARGKLGSSRAAAANDLGNVVTGNGLVAGVFALRRKGDVNPSVVASCERLSSPWRLPFSRSGTTISSVVPG